MTTSFEDGGRGPQVTLALEPGKGKEKDSPLERSDMDAPF